MKRRRGAFLSFLLAVLFLLTSCTAIGDIATERETDNESQPPLSETETPPAALPDLVLPEVAYPLTSYLSGEDNGIHWVRDFRGATLSDLLTDSQLVFTLGNHFTVGQGGLTADNSSWDSVGYATPLGEKTNTVLAQLSVNETEKTGPANAIMVGVRCPGPANLFIDGGIWFLFREKQVTVSVKGESDVLLTNALPFDAKDGFSFRAEDEGDTVRIYGNDVLLAALTLTAESATLSNAAGDVCGVFGRTNIADSGYFRVMSHFAASTISQMRVESENQTDYQPSETVLALQQGASYAFSGLWQTEGKAPTISSRGQIFADAALLSGLFGFTSSYDVDSGRLTISRDAATAIFTIGEDSVAINGEDYDAIAPMIVDGVPLLCVANFAAMMQMAYAEKDGTVLLYAPTLAAQEETEMTRYTARFLLYENTVYNHDDVTCDQTGVGTYQKAPESERLVGIAYSTWHYTGSQWGSGTWDMPLLGAYSSDDRDVIYQHGIWLRDAGVDFVFVDWSNNTLYDPETMWQSRPDFRIIEQATDLLFEVWATIPNAPKICIFLGPGHSGQSSVDSGAHQAKADQVFRDYVQGYPDMYFSFDDKPLLICYGATPTQYGATPQWTDSRYTVRWMTGFVGQQTQLFQRKTLRSGGYWSWEERGAQTYTVDSNKTVEAVTCVASWRAQGEVGDEGYIAPGERAQGATLRQQFQRACDLGARLVLVVSWNEWTSAEQYSHEISKDIEPSQTDGTFYLDLMREQIRKYKGLIAQ